MRASRKTCKKKSSTSPTTAAFLALLTEKKNLKDRCDALAFESQCFFGLAAEAKELREKLADCKKFHATAKTAQNGRG